MADLGGVNELATVLGCRLITYDFCGLPLERNGMVSSKL
jgi:hypothetical protein